MSKPGTDWGDIHLSRAQIPPDWQLHESLQSATVKALFFVNNISGRGTRAFDWISTEVGSNEVQRLHDCT